MAEVERKRSLLERLDEDFVICAEGYVFELERRGSVQAGSFVPEVVLITWRKRSVSSEVYMKHVDSGKPALFSPGEPRLPISIHIY